jgi:hypothetical protein
MFPPWEQAAKWLMGLRNQMRSDLHLVYAHTSMNIVDPILFQARLNPAAPAICVPGAARPLISYGRLERAIHNISRAALAAGLARRWRRSTSRTRSSTPR